MSTVQSISKMDLETLERIRASELEEARMIQRAMLPTEALRAHPVEFVCRCRPMAEVGGDFLDYFPLDDRRLGFYIGDVVGKGLAAAMYAALAVGALRGMHKTGTEPKAVLEVLNRRLRMRVVPGRYCSVQYAVFDPATRELRHANAGLPRPVYISTSGCRELGEGGLPSALFDGASYDQYNVQLAPGDAVLFCTDGLMDARNTDGEDFGVERLLKVCTAHAGEAAETLIGHVFDAVDAFAAGCEHQLDDMTAAILKIS